MEIRTLLLFVLLMFKVNNSICQDITSKSWSYASISSVSENLQDTTLVYSRISNVKKINIGDNNKLVFYANNTYLITLNNDVNIGGSWKIENNNLIFDKDTLSIINIENQQLQFKGKYLYLDETATFRNGFLLISYLSISEIVESIKTGNWNDSSTWTSGRIPNKSDNVTIKQPHRVIFSGNDIGFCKNLLIEFGAVFDCSTNKTLYINPNN